MAAPFSRTTRSLDHDSARPALLTWTLAGLCLVGWFVWLLLGRVTLYEVSRQARLEVASAPHALVSAIAGQVLGTRLEIGREVQAGEVLLELDGSAAQLQWQEERARAQAIEPRQASLRKEVLALQSALQAEQQAGAAAQQAAQARHAEAAAAAEFALDSARRMRSENGTGVAEIDALRAETDARRLAAARDALAAELLRQGLDALTRARQGQVQLEGLQRALVTLEGELDTHRATLARLAQQVELHRLRAPVAGRIAELLPLRAGAHVAEGQKLATLVPLDGPLLMVADFNPAGAMGRLRPGQAARLKLDGFPWTQYGSVDARVLRVAGDLRDNLLRVDLQGTLPAPAGLPLQHGLPGVVEVAVEQVSPATLLLRVLGR